ncbi:MAG: hypothetical protein CL760_01280 [Chloroflexi bacterium]|nr:hypothetical protein [Chloroflexota bacterium]|tara:strand:- start:30198 stop:30473 length:276 start_codon:yes stop_codon:yes gene_type:complete
MSKKNFSLFILFSFGFFYFDPLSNFKFGNNLSRLFENEEHSYILSVINQPKEIENHYCNNIKEELNLFYKTETIEYYSYLKNKEVFTCSKR